MLFKFYKQVLHLLFVLLMLCKYLMKKLMVGGHFEIISQKQVYAQCTLMYLCMYACVHLQYYMYTMYTIQEVHCELGN